MQQDQTLKVRDRRAAKWLWLDNTIIDDYLPLLSTTTFAIYVLLCRYANDNNGECFPSHGTLAAKFKISIGTVKRSLTKLEKLSLIEKVSGAKLGVANIYRLLEAPEIEEGGRSVVIEGVDHHRPTPLDHHRPTNNTNIELSSNNKLNTPATAALERSKEDLDQLFDGIMLDVFHIPLDDKARRGGKSSLVGSFRKQLLLAYPQTATADLLTAITAYGRGNQYAEMLKDYKKFTAAIADHLPGKAKLNRAAAYAKELDNRRNDPDHWKF